MSWKERMKQYEPHPVFKNHAYPKTGGRLGNCYLLWGDELKHDYFPFVAIPGPQWKLSLVALMSPLLVLICLIGSMFFYDSFSVWGLIVGIGIFFVNEFLFLITILSNPGIVFRGVRPASDDTRVRCCVIRLLL